MKAIKLEPHFYYRWLLSKKIISEYKVLFSNELGTPKDFQADFSIDPQGNPKYVCTRPVPYSLKEKNEQELEQLVNLGINQPVARSQWTTPTVPVFKGDGNIRVCCDYKQTVNKARDKYPIPKTEDICILLNGGKFTKLDLSQAYQQLLLSPNSRKLLTINTHKGLFEPTMLQIAAHSESGIF